MTFTHVEVRAATEAAPWTAASQPLPVLEYSDTASLTGPQTINLTLPGRTADTAKGRRPWAELLRVGDVLYSEGWAVGDDPVSAATLAHGLIQSVGESENLTTSGYSYTTTVTAQSGHGVLLRDAVAWWMFYGSVEGWTRARATLTTDQMSGAVDKILANYTSRIAFHRANWQRGSQGLGDLLGYHYRALKANAPVQMNLAMQEGPHWQIMRGATDDLHEFYSTVLPGSAAPEGGFAHRPAPGSAAIPRGRDGGATWLMHRPAPFPFATPEGTGDLSEWNSLPLHDLSERAAQPVRVPLGQVSSSLSSDSVKNYFLVMPAMQVINEEMSFAVGIAVQNKASLARYGYSSSRVRTNLVIGEGTKENMIEFTRRLTWRYAGQHNRRDEMRNGAFSVVLSPQVQPGHRVRLRVPYGDEARLMDGYVTARTHSWSASGGGTTSLTLDRLLPSEVYKDPSWFVQGLELVKVGSDGKVPSNRAGATAD